MKKKWYDLVLSGEKKEEYRLFKPHWATRVKKWLANNEDDRTFWTYDTFAYGTELHVAFKDKFLEGHRICFVNGYQHAAPRFIAHCNGCELRDSVSHPEWGEGEYSGRLHFVFHIGHIEEI